MPHAERETVSKPRTSRITNGNHAKMTSEAVTNGSSPHSQFLSHLTSFPVVHDGIKTYKTNPYGAKSISVAEQALNIITANVYKPLSPYLKTPYSYIAPYVGKADSIGDNTLKKIESRFPIVKEDTATVQKTVTGYAGYPLALADNAKSSVLKVWDDQWKAHEGKNTLVRYGLTAFDTQISILTQVSEKVGSVLRQKKGEAADKFDEKKAQVNNST